jgi:hypothetical protein
MDPQSTTVCTAGDYSLQDGTLALHMQLRQPPTCVNAEVLECELEVGDVWPPLLAAKHLFMQ